MQHETLEARQLLAANVVPQLVGIQPNVGELIQENDVRGIAPRELTFNFAHLTHAGDQIDPTTLQDGIVITKIGEDGHPDVQIVGPGANFEGYIGIGNQPNQVVVRFGETLTDGLYRIEVTDALTDLEGESAETFVRNFELNLAPQVMSVVPQPITRNDMTGQLEMARDTIHVYFNNDDLDPTLAENPDYYQLGFQLGDSNNELGLENGEVAFYPTRVIYNAELDMATLIFDGPIDELVNGTGDQATVFRLQVGLKGIASKFSETIDLVGRDAGSSFDTPIDLSGFVGPVQREDGSVEYDASNPQNLFEGDHEFQVTRGVEIDTEGDGVADVDHTTFTISDGLGHSVTFELTIDGTVATGNEPIDISSVSNGTFALAVRIQNAINSYAAANPSFAVYVSGSTTNDPSRLQLRGTDANRVTMELGADATGLIVDRTQSLIIRGEIRNPWEFVISLAGGNNEPGHRDINNQDHVPGLADQDGTGVTRITYNFPTTYGQNPTSPTHEPFQNQITQEQIQRAREIFQIYAFYAGIEFVEVPSNVKADIGVITGNVSAVNPTAVSMEGGYDSIAGPLSDEYGVPLEDENGEFTYVAIMDQPDHQDAGDDEVGASWQRSALSSIGFLLGLGKTFELPPGTEQGQELGLDFGTGWEPLLPGDFDVTHLQHLYRPDSFDIDMYRFEVSETGRLSAEIIAERLTDSSLLDAALTLYRQNGDGTRTAIARNDDYYSEDSFLEMTLEPGTYFIGVSASGNNVYDPTIEDSGFGGTTEGIYNLQLRFTPNVTETIRDLGSEDQQINSLVVQAGGDAFSDNQTVTLNDGTRSQVYEIFVVADESEDPAPSNPSNIVVKVLDDAPGSEVVAALVNAINSTANFNVQASAVGSRIDLANLGGTNPIVLDSDFATSGAIVASLGAGAGADLDGNLDGTAGGAFNFWFRAEPVVGTTAQDEPRTMIVDANYTGGNSDGSLARPFKTIAAAIQAANQNGRGDVIRITGLGGLGDDQTTQEDNIPYVIGRNSQGAALPDGADIVVPKDSTLMIDEGAILKFTAKSGIIVGSSPFTVDRSFASVQILGIPERFDPIIDESGDTVVDTDRQNRRVTLTSYRETTFANDPDGDRIGTLSNVLASAAPGDWGGIYMSNETDRQEGWGSYQDRGIFLNSIIGADIRYAGGTAMIDGQENPLAPIYMEESRPTINFNMLRFNGGAALSADPNSLEESNYSVFAGAPASFTSDVYRVGPDIYGNYINDNGLNGMLIRIRTNPGSTRQELTVAGRMDDTDIVYIVPEALHVSSTPGGPSSDLVDVLKINSLQAIESGDLLTIFTVDDNGNEVVLVVEFLRNGDTPNVSAGVVIEGVEIDGVATVDLDNLAPQTEEQLADVLADAIENARDDAEDNLGVDVEIDAYNELTSVRLSESATAVFNGNSAIAFEPIMQAHLDASLVVDPGVVVKFNAGRIEVEMGANLIAEGEVGRPVVFTSLQDDRYGYGGTFDTNNNGFTAPTPGNWSGIYFAHTSSGSIDNAVIAFGGGASSIDGEFAHFNAVEIQQADVRLTNSVLEYNQDGQGAFTTTPTRNGHLTNENAVVFVRGAQPIIYGNNFRHNQAAAINVDLSSLNHELIVDWGRSGGALNPIVGLGDNQGALVRDNTLTNNSLNGMIVRGGTLTTQSVWDDTDIAHLVFEQITSADFHTFGGIRLESSSRESLVVKLSGENAGFVATGRQLDIDDRIGGMLHVIGQPGFPVVFTDLADDTVGAGLTQYGTLQSDTNNDGAASTPTPGSWAGLLIDQFANDRNVQVVVEAEANDVAGKGTNGTAQTPQSLGVLAPDEYGGSDTSRLGFEINGFLSNSGDVDVYSFQAIPGTEVWFDIDRTSYFLDPIVELISLNDSILAGSSNSYDQSGGSLYGTGSLQNVTNLLQKSGFYEEDLWSSNPRDAGMRVVLPGTGSTPRTYHVRVRSGSENLTDPNETGTTAGVYQLNIRLREVDEVAGSTIQFADIRYAENGITVLGQPTHSPLLGESAEDLNNNNDTFNNAHALGNLLNSDRGALSVAGKLGNVDGSDIDWYQVGLTYDSVDVIDGQFASLIIDMDYAAGIRANSIVSVFTEDGQLVFTSNSSSVNDDQTNPEAPNSGDLTRGSSGTGDPYLGTIMLPAGTPGNPINYYVAVSSQSQVPVQMDQFFRADATNSMLRLEPISSVKRIVEDHINWPGLYSTPMPPEHNQIIREENARPFTLGDFVMFMSIDSGTEQTQLVAIDPFTGALEANIGKFNREIRDLAMHPDGTLYAYSVDTRPGSNYPHDNYSGNILSIDTGDATITVEGDDGIITYIQKTTEASKVVVGNHATADQEGKADGNGWGYQFQGTTFGYFGASSADSLRAYAIGNRGDVSNSNSAYANILFLMDASNSDGDSRSLLTPESVVTGQHTAGNILGNPGDTNASSAIGRVDTSEGGGGFITGLGWVGSELYGVSSLGSLYRITNGSGSFNMSGEVITPTLLTDTSVNFTSLTAGPTNPAGGDGNTDYADVLFALDSTGRVHAFTEDGDEAHVFQGGRSTLSTGISSGHGLQFGTLNRNLWHFQNDTLHTTDAGHGLSIPVDKSRSGWVGGTSLYFGNQVDTFVQENAYGNKTKNNYDFPGDAHGSIISDSFSLYGYDAADLPTLYFNYFLETDGKDYDSTPSINDPARDTLRVFAAGEDGEWHLLATNNTFKASDDGPYPGGEFDDEFDAYGYDFYTNSTTFGTNVSDVAVDEELRSGEEAGTEGIQQLFDNEGWRQARVDLSSFAGQENIRLRFDFATGGSVNMGGVNRSNNLKDNTEELRFLAGDRIEDGAIFQITDRTTGVTTTFEFNKGQTFTFGSGSQIVDGINSGDDTFELTTAPDDPVATPPVTYIFQYVTDLDDVDGTNIGILISATDTPSQIAQKTAQVIENTASDVSVYFGNSSSPTTPSNSFNIQGIVDLSNADAPDGLRVSGSSGTGQDTTNPLYEVIEYTGGDSAEEVAQSARLSMHRELTPLAMVDADTIRFEMFQVHKEFLYATNYKIDVMSSGIGHDRFLEGDNFGISGLADLNDLEDGNDNSQARGQDNNFQGVFIDDLIIGFAERGEMVSGADNNATGYTDNLDLRKNETLSGAYQLEIRRSIDYGVRDGIGRLILDPTFDFDTNDRLVEGYSIRVPSGANLATGDRITISDGTDSVTFEFFDLDSDSEDDLRGFAGSQTRRTYDSNNDIYSVGFESDFSQSDVARALLAAIQDRAGHAARGLISTPQGVLGVNAQLNNRNASLATSGRIDLSRRTVSDEVVVKYDAVSDDTFDTAYDIGLDGASIAAELTAEEARIEGTIGDNDWRDDRQGIADIDVYRFSAVAGQELALQLEDFFGSVAGTVNATLRLFFQDGTEVLGADDFQIGVGVQGLANILLNDTGDYYLVVSGKTAPMHDGAQVGDEHLEYDASLPPKQDGGRDLRTYEGQYTLRVGLSSNGSFTVPQTEVKVSDRQQRIAIEEYSPERYDDPTIGAYPVGSRGVNTPLYDFYTGTTRVTGDQNRFRDQGQIILSSNYISNSEQFGILIDDGSRSTPTDGGSDGNRPHQGAPRVFASAQNDSRLATGVTIVNNVIYAGGEGGIRYSGDDLAGSNPQGAVPFGRIINNTLYGKNDGDVGIQVDDQAAPTIVNNIIANFETGVDVEATSNLTVINNNLYQGNGQNWTNFADTVPILANTGDPLFVDAANGNFYIAEGSVAIDASVDEMQERSQVNSVINPLGIDPAPILAPNRDITGQVRDFGPNAPNGGGIGSGGFRDIGAFDRVDSSGPLAFLVEPLDNDEEGWDLDSAPDKVQLVSGPMTEFAIQLRDQGEISGQGEGAGIDDSTVSSASVLVEIVGEEDPLVEGVDYAFEYDSTNNVIRIRPTAGVFLEETLYKITLDSNLDSDDAVILDKAGNPIAFNKQVEDEEGNAVGETSFYIQAGGLVDFGDAPDTYGTTLDNDGARHGIVAGFHLGAGIDAESNGTPSAGADSDQFDDGVTIPALIQDSSKNNFYIKASVPSGSLSYGFIDAWIDMNNDGVFSDSEQIMKSLPLTAEAVNNPNGQLFSIINLPDGLDADQTPYTTYARFRLSSTGGLSATGAAEDGEVEDYQVTIGPPVDNPWHNEARPEAVSTKDNIVTGVDLNLLIRELSQRNYTYSKDNAPAGKIAGDFTSAWDPISNPDLESSDVPAYFDVNNDFRVTTLDLLQVRNFLTGSANPEPLEMEAIGDSMVATPVSDMLATIEVEQYEFAAPSQATDNQVSSTESLTTAPPMVLSESVSPFAGSSFDAIAPSYSDLQMKSALDQMGFVQSDDATAFRGVNISFLDEAISWDEVATEEHLDQLIGTMASDLTSTWEEKTFEDDAESELDDLDELLALLTESAD